MVSFGLRIFVTSKQRVIACERCAGETEDDCFFQVAISMRIIIIMHFLLQYAPQVNITMVQIWQKTLQSLAIILSPKTLSKQCVELFVV